MKYRPTRTYKAQYFLLLGEYHQQLLQKQKAEKMETKKISSGIPQGSLSGATQWNVFYSLLRIEKAGTSINSPKSKCNPLEGSQMDGENKIQTTPKNTQEVILSYPKKPTNV